MSTWRTESGQIHLGGNSGSTPAGPSPEAALEVALSLMRADKIREAEASCAQTLQAFPEHVPAWHLLAQIKRARQQPAVAFAVLSHAIRLAPGDFALFNDAGLCLNALGRFAEATAHFDRALELKPDAVSALVNRANAHARMRRTDEAIAGYRTALEQQPENAVALMNLAAAFEHTGRLKEAAQTVKQAMSVARETPALNLTAARLERRAGRFDKAKARLELMLKQTTEPAIEAGIVRELGHVADAQAEYAGALKHYRRANKLTERLLRTGTETGALPRRLDALERWLETNELPAAEGGTDHGSLDQANAQDGDRSPVFIVGFPGAGTHSVGAALLDQGYAHLGMERALWGQMMEAFVAAKETLTTEVKADLIARYVSASPADPNSHTIEVVALGLLYAPVLLSLFPDARFVYVRRDADDTLLTAATQLYLATEVAPYLLKPPQTRRLLERVEHVWSQLRAWLGPRAHTVNYESLFHSDSSVSEPAWRSLGAFLGDDTLGASRMKRNVTDDENRYPVGHAQHYRDWLR